MALSNQEIEQLQQQLKEKKEEIRVIYNKLLEAGVAELPEDILDAVAGGQIRPTPTPDWINSISYKGR